MRGSPYKNKINQYNDEDSPLIAMSNIKTVDSKYSTISSNNNNNNKHNKHIYFNDKSYIITLLKNDEKGRSIRATITLCWGLISVLYIGIPILMNSFKYSLERSLFISVASIITIGYGPNLDANDKKDHYFLTGYFILCVFPFTILQIITINDAIQSKAELIHHRINEKITNDKSDGAAIIFFRNEALHILFTSLVILLLLLLFGTIIYRYMTTDQRTWTDALFNCVATVTTVGYGTFNIEKAYAYYIATLFAIISNYTVSVIIANIGSVLAAASQNLDSGGSNNYDRDNIAIF
jgi:hypothetical protein